MEADLYGGLEKLAEIYSKYGKAVPLVKDKEEHLPTCSAQPEVG